MEPAPQTERETEPAARPAELAPASMPGGAEAAVLNLQRQIGNRGVRRLLRETDPRLTYNATAIAEGAGLDAQKLPWRQPGDESAGWDALEILGKLTQVDESAATFTDAVRCGANSVLAVAITRGPLDTEVFARQIMLRALGRSQAPAESAEGHATMGKAYLDIWPAIRAIGNGTATYGDLSSIAHHAKLVMSQNPTGVTTGHEVSAMAGLLGGMQESGAPIEDAKHLKTLAQDLKPGQSFIVLVGTNVWDETSTVRSTTQTNHYVVVGRDTEGKFFLYDPYPRVGTQLLRSGDPNFWTLFKSAKGTWKASYIFVRPKFG